MRLVVHVLLWSLPWSLRRRLLNLLFGYEIAPAARIGFSIVAPRHLTMADGAVIGHLNLIRGMDRLTLDRGAGISHLNWVYGIPHDSGGFPSQHDRRSEFILDEGGGITNRHFVDCTNRVHIGRYAMVAGYGTQILTHSVDMASNRQSSKPIAIGEYSLVGTRSILLGGSSLPDRCALGAGSVLRSAFGDPYTLYSGVPARAVGKLPPSAKYFTHDVPGVPGHRFERRQIAQDEGA